MATFLKRGNNPPEPPYSDSDSDSESNEEDSVWFDDLAHIDDGEYGLIDIYRKWVNGNLQYWKDLYINGKELQDMLYSAIDMVRDMIDQTPDVISFLEIFPPFFPVIRFQSCKTITMRDIVFLIYDPDDDFEPRTQVDMIRYITDFLFRFAPRTYKGEYLTLRRRRKIKKMKTKKLPRMRSFKPKTSKK